MRARKFAVISLLLLAIIGLIWWLAKNPKPFLMRTAGHKKNVSINISTGQESPNAPLRFEQKNIKADTSLQPPSPALFVKDDKADFGLMEGKIVSWSSGSGVDNAELTFIHEGISVSAHSQSDGRFVFRPHKEGRYSLAAVTADDYLPYAPAWGQSPIVFTAREHERISGVVLYLLPALEYTGRVIDPDEQPVSKAQVKRLDSPDKEQVLYSSQTQFMTDHKGEFIFNAPDWALFEAYHSDFSPGRSRLDFSAQVSHTMTIKLKPKTGNPEEDGHAMVITGIVLLPDGSPASDAVVKTQTFRESLRRTAYTIAAGDGRFNLSGLDAGSYNLMALLKGFAPASKHEVPVGTKNLILKLNTGVGIEGHVTLASSGIPVPAFSVWIGEHKGPIKLIKRTTEVVYDSTGFYQVRGLGSGEYFLLVSAQGYAPQRKQHIKILETQQQPTQVDFSLINGGSLRGVVLQKESKIPLKNARISVEGLQARGPSALPTLASATTNETGHFVLTSLEPGECSITIAASDHHAQIQSGLHIQEGQDSGPIIIELTPVEEGEKPKLELAGIGAVLEPSETFLLVKNVISGSGAEEIGLKPGDKIFAVDGQPVVELGFEGSIQRIRGPENSSVVLLIQKREANEAIAISVPRRKIRA